MKDKEVLDHFFQYSRHLSCVKPVSVNLKDRRVIFSDLQKFKYPAYRRDNEANKPT